MGTRSASKVKIAAAAHYAVHRGRKPGVYATWALAEEQVRGFQGAVFRKFPDRDGAVKFALLGPVADDVIGTLHRGKTAIYVVSSDKAPPGGDVSALFHGTTDLHGKERPSHSVPIPISPAPLHCTDGLVGATRHVYTDGACLGNGTPGAVAGFGVFFGVGSALNRQGPVDGEQTNQRAELAAVHAALIVLQGLKWPDSEVIIHTDSQYAIRCYRDYVPQWLCTNWTTQKGTRVQHADIIRATATILDAHPEVRMRFVKGHSGIPGNEGADALATQAAQRARRR